MGRILVVDDERSMRDFLEILLTREDHQVLACETAEQALEALASDDFDVIISDIRMPGISGIELLERVRESGSVAPVILITAHGTAESAVEAMKLGAYDYLTKPCSVDEIQVIVAKALEKNDLASENRSLRRQLQRQADVPAMIGKSERMRDVFEVIRQVAPTPTNVLVTGRSGTGKELVARAIHQLSDRADQPFVAINCGAIPENLLESELFGHMKGSFTGAVSQKEGLFESADGGTLFLDEIGEMPLALQVKVLRAIQDRCFKRVGGTSDIRVDVRIVAATNRVLADEVREGRFREDLYYRLNVIEIALPSLSERPDDIPELVRCFCERYSAALGKQVRAVDPEVLACLEDYPFPGNVRELENLIERAVTLARADRISLDCLPANVLRPEAATQGPLLPSEGGDLNQLLADYERTLVRAALERSGGVKKRAASLLGISFRSFRYRLEKLGLESDDEDA